MNNADIARVFSDMADLLELKSENKFKIRAYQKAARNIEFLSIDLEQLVKQDREEELLDIPGVGEAIAKKITELVTTGKLQLYERLKTEFPEGISSLLEIPGIGPKTAMLLAKELGVKTIDELEAAIVGGEVSRLYRMGDKTAENILHQIQATRRKDRRIPIGEALTAVDGIIAQLKEVPGLANVTPAGSLRRFQETIGDIDLMATSTDPQKAMQVFTHLPQVKEVLVSGPNKSSIVVAGGLQVDFRVIDADAFGSMLQYFTGSKQHNINLRERARRQGLSLSEYGITDIKTGKLEKYATEEAFYERLGLQYIPPEIRQGAHEIERAEQHDLPRLVEMSDIKGDLHAHTTSSDGRDTIEAMALAAKARGYEYILIADHSAGRGIAHGLTVERLRQQIAEIKALNRGNKGIRVLAGMEMDIRADGTLDLPDDVLAELDIVVGAVHSGMNQPAEQITARIVKAMENPNLDILAHPTCRLLPGREPIAADMEAIFQAALRTRTVLEINASPSRLDLKDIHAYRARELGVKLVISTDAHAAEHFDFVRFGVGMARRAWCQSSDIINTLPLAKMLASLKQGGRLPP